MKIDFEVLTRDIVVLIEVSESKMSDVRAEYDKVARILEEIKRYNWLLKILSLVNLT
jgi:hypothetical protein